MVLVERRRSSRSKPYGDPVVACLEFGAARQITSLIVDQSTGGVGVRVASDPGLPIGLEVAFRPALTPAYRQAQVIHVTADTHSTYRVGLQWK